MDHSHQPTSTSAEQYAQAYALHYTDRNLLAALRGYMLLADVHPQAREAEYARSQIRNIVSSVVPDDELLAAASALACGHLERLAAVDANGEEGP